MQITEEQKKDILKKRSKRFVRQDINKKDRLEEKWHYPKGIHSKLRHRKRGYGLIVKTGYKTPKFIRGRTLDGKLIITVQNKEQLPTVSEDMIIQLSSTLGKRKRLEILTEIVEKKLPYVGDAEKEINVIKDLLKQRKELRSQKKARKQKIKHAEKKEEKEEKSEEGKKTEEKGETEEVEKKKEKKEFDKLLTKEK